MFTRIYNPLRKSHIVAQQILEQIRDGQLNPGDKLPPERTIAEEMHVSRAIVREAMSALQLHGLVESRVGDGTYITGKRAAPITHLRFREVLDQLEVGLGIVEALEAREALDITAAHLAIENAQPADIECISHILERMSESIEAEDFSTYIDLTFDFHIAVAKACGNRVVEQGVSFLADFTRKNKSLIEDNYTERTARRSFAVHQSIFDSIRQKDTTRAIECIRDHYRNYPSLEPSESTQETTTRD